MNSSFWHGKRVAITGHTGFKGGWLSSVLSMLGAKLYGFALFPSTKQNFFESNAIGELFVSSHIGDILDVPSIRAFMDDSQPEILFHLAAQPIVLDSYREPVNTFEVNVLGTALVLDAARETHSLNTIVNITTDKVYENHEWCWPYRETDQLGGHDPYSASKACAELVTRAYRRSFLGPAGKAVATARAGNVIGGGDWSPHRLIPDLLRAADSGTISKIRNPKASRPWQHVLDPIVGYLSLAEYLYDCGSNYIDCWNFGPDLEEDFTVEALVSQLSGYIPDVKYQIEHSVEGHEAGKLRLDSSRAKELLNWKPRWSTQEAIRRTAEWHLALKEETTDMRSFTNSQIRQYLEL